MKVKLKYVRYLCLVIMVAAVMKPCAATAFLGSEKAKAEMEEQKKAHEAELSKLKGQYDQLDAQFKELQEKYDHTVMDRDNILSQTKRLLEEKGEVSTLKAAAQDLEQKNAALSQNINDLETAKQAMLTSAKAQEDKIAALQKQADDSLLEQKRLQETLTKEREASGKLELEAANAQLLAKQGELEKVITQLKGDRAKSQETMERLRLNIEDLEKGVQQMNEDYAGLVDRNRDLESKLMNIPRGFAEIARQNKSLIAETANMHYNIGVFYMENREYQMALKEFEKSLDLNPEDSSSHFNVGYIYAQHIVDRDKAIDHFQQYLRLTKEKGEHADWAKNYIVTWEAWDGKKPMQ